MSKDSLAKHCQNNKEDYKKELVKEIKVFLKKEKKKKQQYGQKWLKKSTKRWKTKACWV